MAALEGGRRRADHGALIERSAGCGSKRATRKAIGERASRGVNGARGSRHRSSIGCKRRVTHLLLQAGPESNSKFGTARGPRSGVVELRHASGCRQLFYGPGVVGRGRWLGAAGSVVRRWQVRGGGSKAWGRGSVLLSGYAESLLGSGRDLPPDDAELRLCPTPRAALGLALGCRLKCLVLTGATSLLQVSEVLSQEYKDGLQLTHPSLKGCNWGPVSTDGGIACCFMLAMPGRHLMDVILCEGPVVRTALNCQHDEWYQSPMHPLTLRMPAQPGPQNRSARLMAMPCYPSLRGLWRQCELRCGADPSRLAPRGQQGQVLDDWEWRCCGGLPYLGRSKSE